MKPRARRLRRLRRESTRALFCAERQAREYCAARGDRFVCINETPAQAYGHPHRRRFVFVHTRRIQGDGWRAHEMVIWR